MADTAAGAGGKSKKFEKAKRRANFIGFPKKKQHQGKQPAGRFEVSIFEWVNHQKQNKGLKIIREAIFILMVNSMREHGIWRDGWNLKGAENKKGCTFFNVTALFCDPVRIQT